MERFFWRDRDPPPEERTIERRFPETVRGYEAWRALARAVDEDPFGERPEFLRSAFDTFLVAANGDTRPLPPTCCLFISHRMNDVNNALHIAWVATQCGYDYWLDVHDPKLLAANRVAALKSGPGDFDRGDHRNRVAQRHPCRRLADAPQRRISMDSLRAWTGKDPAHLFRSSRGLVLPIRPRQLSGGIHASGGNDDKRRRNPRLADASPPVAP